MKKILWLLLAGALLLPTPVLATLLFQADFNSGTLLAGPTPDLSDANGCCSYSKALSTAQSREGGQSARFESRSNDPISGNTPGKTMLGWNGIFTSGQERWYGFSIYVDPSWQDDTTDPNGTILVQWHNIGDACDSARSPSLGLQITHDDNWQFRVLYDANACGGNSTVTKINFNLGAVAKGVWTDWVVYARHTYASTGVLRVWKNGVQVIERNGPNDFNDTQNASFIRFGIYKSWWLKNAPSPADTLISYIDAFKIGDANSNFSEVAPDIPPLPVAPTALNVTDN